MQDEVSRDDRFTACLEQTGLKPGDLVVVKQDLGLECDQLVGQTPNWIDVDKGSILMYVGQDVWPDRIDTLDEDAGTEFPALVFLFDERMVFWPVNDAETTEDVTEGFAHVFATSPHEVCKALALEEMT